MNESLAVKIGPIGLSLHWSGSRISGWPHQSYEDFLTEGPCEVTLEVHCGPLPAYRTDELLFEARDNRWNLYRTDGHYLLEMFDTETGEKSRVVLLNQQLTSGEVYLTPESESPPSWSVPLLLRHLGELLVVNLLSRDRGFLIHAAGINDGGAGLLFVGPSGSGKTTLANLYHGRPGVTVLSDERTIISRSGPQFVISGTPWPGGAMLASAASVPLRRIFVIEHAPRNVLYAEKRATLAGLLFQQLFLPFWDRHGLTSALSLADDLLRTVPAHRLGFVNDPGVIEFLRGQAREPARSYHASLQAVPWPGR